MENLGPVLAQRYPNADSYRDYSVEDHSDGEGPRLVCWDEEKLGPRPTDKQLAKWDSDYVPSPLPTKREQITKMLDTHGLTLDDLKAELSK